MFGRICWVLGMGPGLLGDFFIRLDVDYDMTFFRDIKIVMFEMALEHVNCSKSSPYGKIHSVMYTFRARLSKKQNCNIQQFPILGILYLMKLCISSLSTALEGRIVLWNTSKVDKRFAEFTGNVRSHIPL